MKISVYVAIGVESRTFSSEHSRTNVFLKFGKGGDFGDGLNLIISETKDGIMKQVETCRCDILIRTTDSLHFFFDISDGFWDILKKALFKKVRRGLGFTKTSWLWSK